MKALKIRVMTSAKTLPGKGGQSFISEAASQRQAWEQPCPMSTWTFMILQTRTSSMESWED